MLVNIFVIQILLVAIVMPVLGIKMWFDPDAEFTLHSCKLEEENSSSIGGCSIQMPVKRLGRLS